MAQVRAKWLTFYAEHIEPVSREIFSHVEKNDYRNVDRVGRRRDETAVVEVFLFFGELVGQNDKLG